MGGAKPKKAWHVEEAQDEHSTFLANTFIVFWREREREREREQMYDNFLKVHPNCTPKNHCKCLILAINSWFGNMYYEILLYAKLTALLG